MPQRITTNFISAFAPFSSSLTCVVAVRSDASEGPGAFGIAKTERERERWRGIVSSERAAGAFLVEGEGEGLTNASGVEPEGLDWGDEVGGIDGRVQNEAGLAVEVAGEKPGLRSRSRWEGGRFLRWRSLNEREEEIASVDSLGDLGEGGGARDSPVDPVDRATAAGLCARALCLRARRGGAPTATRTILWRSSWRASDLDDDWWGDAWTGLSVPVLPAAHHHPIVLSFTRLSQPWLMFSLMPAVTGFR